MSRRVWILAIALLLEAAGMLFIQSLLVFIIVEPVDGWSEAWRAFSDPPRFIYETTTTGIGRTYVLVPVMIVVISQAVFLLPQFRDAPKRSEAGHSLKWSLVAASLVAAMLFTAFFLAAVSVLSLIGGREGELPGDPTGDWIAIAPHWFFPPLVLSWVMWSVVLYRFALRKPGRTLSDRLIGLLLAGTILETLIVIPIDIMVRRKTDCYCSTGTFHSLWLSGLALLWLAGPGAALALTSRRRRIWAEAHCLACGYEKGPTPGAICPECGEQWRDETATPPAPRAA